MSLVRTRSSTRNPGQVTVYAAALPGDTTKAGSPVWYGGGKLAADLTLPKLRRRWSAPGSSRDDPFTPAELGAVWSHSQLIELFALVGFYGMLAGIVTASGVAREAGIPGWPAGTRTQGA